MELKVILSWKYLLYIFKSYRVLHEYCGINKSLIVDMASEERTFCSSFGKLLFVTEILSFCLYIALSEKFSTNSQM